MVRLVIIIVTFILMNAVNPARILGVFPTPSMSHQIVFRALMHELASRGHEVVTITTDPILPKNRPPDNITEIDLSFTYDNYKKFQSVNKWINKRGVIREAEIMNSVDVYKYLTKMIDEQMDHAEIQKLLKEKPHFDLLIIEGFLNYQLVFSDIFKAPTISMLTFHGVGDNYETIGAIPRHPLLFPEVFRKNFGEMTVIEKIKEIKFEYDAIKMYKKLAEFENQLLKKKFGPNTPTIQELKKNIDFMFFNSHQVFCNNRPVPPNVAYVGPLHLQPPKALPADLQEYLDNSKTGVIYVSLGTNIHTENMDADLLQAFLHAFESLPYDILWKFNGESLKDQPRNLKIQKWFPQRDLLYHPNIKLFVTQAGLQSTDESIDAGVPLVAIPMLGDQYYNAYKYEELGIGVRVDALTLDSETLLRGINTVLKDEKYKKNILKLKEMLNDNPQSPMDRAVWWIEYVLRHQGAKHLKSPTANITLSEYLMVDVLTVVAVSLILFSSSVSFIVFMIVRLILNKISKKNKLKSS